MAQRQYPGGPYLNETGTRQAQYPGRPFANETTGGGGGGVIPIFRHHVQQQGIPMIYLRQSTASQEVMLGQFVDSTDGSTPETGLTIANTDIRVQKAGSATFANKNSGGATHVESGYYIATLDATDTDTLGSGLIKVAVSGALIVQASFTVLPPQVFDSLVLGSDLLDVNTAQVSGTAQTAGDLSAQLVAVQADTNDIQTRLPAALVGGRIDASVGAMAADTLTASALAADAVTEIQAGLATAAALAVVDGTVDAILVDTAEIGAAGAGLAAIPWNAAWDAEVQSEVTDALNAYDPPTNAELTARTLASADYATAAALATVDANVDDILVDTGTTIPGLLATIAGYIDTEVAAVKAVTDKLDTALVLDGAVYQFTANALELAPTGGSAPTASAIADEVQTRTIAAVTVVNGLAANTVNAAALAADAVTEIQSGLATAAALATVDGIVDEILIDTGTSLPAQLTTIAGYLDTEIAAVLAVTNKLDTTLQADGADWQFTAAALDLAPTGGAAPTVQDIVDGVLDEALAGHVTPGTVGAAITDTDLRGRRTVIRGTAASGGSTTSFTPSALSPAGAAENQFQGRVIIFDNDTATAALRGQATDITANTAAALPVLTFSALTNTPAAGDTFSIV